MSRLCCFTAAVYAETLRGLQETSITKQANFKRRVRARMARTGESFAPVRADLVEAGPASDSRLPRGALHVTNGDSTVLGLQATELADVILPWRDTLHEGPVPAVSDDELRSIRSAFLATRTADGAGTRGMLAARDELLDAYRRGDYVLWFEADLYDQLQLVQILSRLRELRVPPERVTLICVGEYPGFAHFGGLGELTSEQLARLPEMAAAPLTSGALEHAVRAWAALRAPDPSGLAAIASSPSRELRFVAEAFDRLSREYPSARDGLSLSERRILAAIDESGTTAGAAFVRSAARETRPFLGDLWCFDRIERMLHAPTPLLAADAGDGRVGRSTSLALTRAGRRVLHGQDDHVLLNGVDRWIGGVHLQGRDVPWRWHDSTESIIRSGTA